MTNDTRHLGVRIARRASDVYAYVADPANLPSWSAGLGSGIAQVDGEWWIDAPDGKVRFAFVPANEFGVLDHHVTFPGGETFYNPMRVVPYGEWCEVVFSVRRFGELTDAEFERDVAAVAADLAKLRDLLEGRS